MPSISYSGTLNTAALVVPDLYVVIVKPSVLALNGVATNIVGGVGTASYGPVNSPIPGGGYADFAVNFGDMVPRVYDLGTHVYAAQLAGASSFCFVRVTDGTDTASALAPITSGANVSPTFTAPYTGSGGTGTKITVTSGRSTGAFQAVIQRAGRVAEVYDGGVTNPFTTWAQLVTAINAGIPGGQPASKLVIASGGTGAAFAMAANLTGGSDGAANVTPAQLLGVDGLTTTGMYALRGQNCITGFVADLTAATYVGTVDAFAQSEGVYMQQALPNGTGIAAAVAAKQALALSAYTKLLHGDFVYMNDTINSVIRMVNPQGFAAGRLAALSPEQSGLNKPIPGIVGSYFAGQGGSNAYSSGQLQALFAQDIDVIAYPAPGGNFWALRLGHNASGIAGIDGDNYPRLTSFIARTLSTGMGAYVGSPINDRLFRNVTSTLLGFLGNLLQQGILATQDGALPYAVVCNATNNPQARTALGYVQADVQVRYQGINEKFIVNLQGGQTVTVTTNTTGS